MKLHGKVTKKQRLLEKKPGVDDVCLVTLDGERPIQVDAPVFDLMSTGQTVNKRAWEASLKVDGQQASLDWSPDFWGMIWAMPLTVAICVLAAGASATLFRK
ncbi:MAG: hypothetical protein ACTHK7_17270 [Aureliella sp.]